MSSTALNLAKLSFSFSSLVQPYYKIDIETENYRLKTADSLDELKATFKLRYQVFYKEFSGQTAPHPWLPYDIDSFDLQCDHLVVKDKKSDKIVACYRLLPPEGRAKTREYYSEHEFDIAELEKMPGRKLELGRACVHPDFRQGQVLSLLWKGLLRYTRQANCRFLFGCSSVTNKEFTHLPFLMEDLEKRNAFLADIKVEAQPEFSLKTHTHMNKHFADQEAIEQRPRMAPLLGLYLLAGAKVAKDPGYDLEFDCLDFFTILDFENINQSFLRKWN